MTTKGRGEEAALPPVQRPPILASSDGVGTRPRVSHLLRFARLNAGQKPRLLENTTRVATKGDSTGRLSYRDAVLQVLMNTPMFVNFIRAHYRRFLERNKKCPVMRNCLSCSMASLVGWYWAEIRSAEATSGLKDAVSRLWHACTATFWEPKKHDPTSTVQDFYTEPFLLHLLAAMQRQLEASPSEWHTFRQMFTINEARRYKCCTWTTTHHRGEALYLPIDVQKPTRLVPHTEILAGIKRALIRQAQILGTRRGDSTAPRCAICNKLPNTTEIHILDFPEVLILVRNMDPVEGKEDVIIPYQEELSLHDLTGVSVSEQIKPQLARDYALVAGTAEVRYAAGTSKHVAFVRGGPVQLIKNWFIIDDDRDGDGPNDLTENGLTVLNQLQSQGNATDKNVWYNILPEIFVYVRTDDVGVKDPNYQQEFLKNFGLVSPVDTDEAYRDKRLAGRGVTDIFTQRIGRGLLKFKVQLAPADPGPDESVPFTLEMGYELDKKQWSVKEKIYGRLEPHDVNQGVPEEAEETPIERQPFKRYQKRGVGPATPRDTFFPAGVSSTAYIQPGSTTQPRKISTFADKAFATTGQGAFDSVNQNPFSSTDNTETNVDNMDVDEKLTTNWATRPEIRQAFEEAQQKAKREANRDYDRDTWGANQNNGKHGGGGKHHKHDKHHDRKGAFGKNFKGGNNGHGHGGKHHGAFGGGNHMGKGGNRGGVRGGRGGRGRGRGRGQ